jgi:hypothetical protein
MFVRIQQPKSFSQLVSGFLLLILLSSGMNGMLCPHMAGSSHHCGTSALVVRDAHHQAMNNHTQMDREQTDETQEAFSTASTGQSDVAIISQKDEQCSHCLAHSQSTPKSTLQLIVNGDGSSDIAAADTSSRFVQALQSTITLLDLHGHSPPGSTTARHVLISTFRI